MRRGSGEARVYVDHIGLRKKTVNLEGRLFPALSEHFFEKFVITRTGTINWCVCSIGSANREALSESTRYSGRRRVDHIHNRSDSLSMTGSNPLKRPRSSASLRTGRNSTRPLYAIT